MAVQRSAGAVHEPYHTYTCLHCVRIQILGLDTQVHVLALWREEV